MDGVAVAAAAQMREIWRYGAARAVRARWCEIELGTYVERAWEMRVASLCLGPEGMLLLGRTG